MLAFLLLALVTPASTTWTVDANGGGDFTQIADAITAVAAGDVLLVEPGTYEGFALNKRLTILGRAGGPRPHVAGDVLLQASTFTLAGFDLEFVHVSGVSGRGRIDDCDVRVPYPAEPAAALIVEHCAQLVISRTIVVGEMNYSGGDTPAGSGMTIQSSRVTLVQCEATGGWGDDQDGPAGSGPYPGGSGLAITDGSDVVLAGTTLVGGPGGWPYAPFIPGGSGGTAVSLNGSTAFIRGDSTDKLAGGEPGFNSSTYGKSIKATDSTVVSSGLQYTGGGFSFSNSPFVQPTIAEAFLAVSGETTPGATTSIELHGPPGATALLAASLEPSLVALPAFEGQLWLDPSLLLALIPIGTTGQDTPVTLSVSLPRSLAGLEGTCFELQAFFPMLPGALDPGKKFAGNVAEIIVRL